MLKIIFEVLLFAVSLTFLMSWGYIKKQRQSEELLNNLYKKCEVKICKEFKKNEVLSKNEIKEIIKGTKSSLFWSKKKIQVTDPKIFIDIIIDDLINRKIIVGAKGKTYRLYNL
ncbi:MAG: hypothetical protein WBA54_05330 [Acidaminobacteraceae bacterium]